MDPLDCQKVFYGIKSYSFILVVEATNFPITDVNRAAISVIYRSLKYRNLPGLWARRCLTTSIYPPWELNIQIKHQRSKSQSLYMEDFK